MVLKAGFVLHYLLRCYNHRFISRYCYTAQYFSVMYIDIF